MILALTTSPIVWLIEIALLIGLLVVCAKRFFGAINRYGWTVACGKALIWILIADYIAFFLPYLASAIQSPLQAAVPESLLQSLYAVIQAVSIQAPTADALEIAHGILDDQGFAWIASIFGTLINLLAALTPLVIVTTAIGSLKSKFSHFQLHMMRRNHRVAYVFSDLNDSQVSLALDIVRNRRRSSNPNVGIKPHSDEEKPSTNKRLKPLIVFCDIDAQKLDENSSLVQSLRDKGRGDIVFTESSPSEILDELGHFDNCHCFFLSDQHENNVESTAEFLTDISYKACEVAHGSQNKSNEDPKKIAEDFALKFSVYCTNDSHEDEMLFDSLPSEDPTPEEIEQRFDFLDEELSDEELSEAVKNLSEIMQAARSRIEVRLISFWRERIYDVLTRQPLYKVLDPISQNDERDEPQQLWVIVVGLGCNGLEALKTAYWLGRMRDVDLHILGMDARADEIQKQLVTQCPEMMEELDSDNMPVVRISQAQVFTEQFDDTIRSLPYDARVYALVTLGNDQLNLNVALGLRRTFDEMMLDGLLDDPGQNRRPMVLPLINARETFNAAERISTDRNESFDIIPFGQTKETFSFANIVLAPWERYSIAMAAAYREMFGCGDEGDSKLRGTDVTVSFDDTLVEYGEYEIKKLSNRTSTRHIPYRLWSMGIDPTEIFDDRGVFRAKSLSNEKWFEKLGINKHEADELLHPGATFNGEESSLVQLQRSREAFAREHPTVSMLADIEHDRWVAFYRSQGWRDLTIEECEKMVQFGLIKNVSVHQSPKLRRHCYLCNIDTLLVRGAELNDDPFVYDRAAIVETQRILAGTIFS